MGCWKCVLKQIKNHIYTTYSPISGLEALAVGNVSIQNEFKNSATSPGGFEWGSRSLRREREFGARNSRSSVRHTFRVRFQVPTRNYHDLDHRSHSDEQDEDDHDLAVAYAQ